MAMTAAIILVILGGVFAYLYLISFDKDSRDLVDRVKSLQGNYSPKMGKFAADNQAKKAEARTNLVTTLVQEVRSVANLIGAESDANLANYDKDTALERVQREDELTRALQENQHIIIKKAGELGVDPETYKRGVLMKWEIQAEAERERIKVEADVERAVRIKMFDYEIEKKLAGLERLMFEYKQMIPLAEWKNLNKELSLISKEYHQLKASASTPYEKTELKRLKGQMETLVKTIEKKQDRL